MLSEIERFVNWVHWRSPGARTWRDYGYDLHLFAKFMGDVPPNEVNYCDVDRFILMQSNRGLKPTTINRRLGALRSFYDFLISEGQQIVCPILPRRHHLREPQRLPRPVREEDLQRFFSKIRSPRDLAIFLLMLRCGLRISEAASLSLSDLYLNQPYPQLLIHGKGSRERIVYLPPHTEQALREYLKVRPRIPVDSVFVGMTDKHLSSAAIHRCLIRYREQSRVNLTSHRLRHTFANDLLNANVPITTIQKLLGHRWIETTQNYAMANDRQVRDDFFAACERLDTWKQAPGKEVDPGNSHEQGLGLRERKVGMISVRIPSPTPVRTCRKRNTRFLKPDQTWLMGELECYLSLRQCNWKPTRCASNARSFWAIQLTIWHFLCDEVNISNISDLTRQHLLDYATTRLKTGHAASSVNTEMRNFHSFLVYLGDKGYKIPPPVAHIPTLKVPESLPRHLSDDQIALLQADLENRALIADGKHRQDALLERAIFHLLWQCGLRSGEVQDLRLDDLNLDDASIMIQDGKGRKDRTVFVTHSAIRALQDYLPLRGEGTEDHVFLIQGVSLQRNLIYRRMKAAGMRVGVRMSPHRLRHTCATQLLNAGCRLTSVQRLLGHQRLNTTMIYARLDEQIVKRELSPAFSIDKRLVLLK